MLLGHVTDASFLGVPRPQYVVRTDGGADIPVFAQNAGGRRSSSSDPAAA